MTIPFDPHPDFQEYAHPEALVSASWLSARLGTPGLKVVESDEDTLLYDIGHIPGAVRIDWLNDLNDPNTRDYIDGESFAKLMDAKGIARDDTVVIYGDKNNWWAAFTFWIFTLFGHKDVRLLNGGRDAWITEERDTSFTVPNYPATGYPIIERNDAASRIFASELLENLNNQTLIDVRDEANFAGGTLPQPLSGGALRHGHIPGAINLPDDRSMYPNCRFRSLSELKDVYDLPRQDDDIVVYCALGDRAAHSWFVLKYLLGYDKVRNYDGGWLEWGNMVRLPIANSAQKEG
ncbi:MAG: sulfurtransferase [Corynebacterium sp.]|nr:sulfurtransferase [Corynebacterium sp.]